MNIETMTCFDWCRSAPVPGLPIEFPAAVSGELRKAKKRALVSSISREQRLDMLERLHAGEVVELDVGFRAFQQTDGLPNKNFLRFKSGMLRKFAASFVGMPVLRDHDQHSIEARAGTVTDSELIRLSDGTIAIDMMGRFSAPWAVEAVLYGTLDRFSIGWDYPSLSSINCSVCKCPVLTKCEHLPGDELENGVRVEFVFTAATGVEVSGVSVPAVAGTGISEIRAALSARFSQSFAAPKPGGGEDKSEQRTTGMDNIAKALGLKPDADQETILAAIRAKDARCEQAEEVSATLRAENTELSQRAEKWERENKALAVDRLFARYADRFPKTRNEQGEVVVSPLETSLRALAEKDAAGVEATLASLPQLSPTEAAPQSLSPTEKPEEKPALLPVLSPALNAALPTVMQQLGLSAEDVAKFNPISGSEVDPRALWFH